MITTETERLQTLHDLYVLDTPEEQEFEELVRLTAMICSTPIAQVSLIDEDRQWTKASFGVPRQETSRLSSFCTHTIERKELFCVEDAQLDEQFRHNPFVTGDLNLRFYAGMPLVIKGNAIGALCVIDKVPRKLSDAQNDALAILAHQVQIQLEVRSRQKQLELALIDQQQLALLLQHNFTELTLFLDSVAVILIGLDPAGTITRWNATASSMFGISRDEVMYKRLDECGIQWLEGTINLAEWLADTESEKRIDAVFITEAGKRWLGMTIRRLPQQNANLSFEYLVSATDTTNHRMLEEQVRQAHKLNAIGGLAAGIAHEINSPTQFIGDNISFIRDSWMKLSEAIRLGRSLREEVSEAEVSAPLLEAHDAAVKNADLDYVLEEYPKAMDQALDGVQRIASIVNAMKEFSHPGSQNKVLLDLHHCINTAIALARNEWKYVADVVTEFDPELPPLFCHAVEIGQVLLNLIVNAGHAISERAAKDPSLLRGQIVIFTRHRDQEAEIRIQDNGCGIPDSITSRVFEPFFTTKEVGKGTGQGLAIAHSIVVNKHGGRLWFESPLDGGTCFIIRIPICDPILSASMIPLSTGAPEEFS